VIYLTSPVTEGAWLRKCSNVSESPTTAQCLL
jgi:hypothetical protein